jgi:hypothetical protein
MGLALIGGAFFARAKRYRAHARSMAAVVILNLVAIITRMWPSFEVLAEAAARVWTVVGSAAHRGRDLLRVVRHAWSALRALAVEPKNR